MFDTKDSITVAIHDAFVVKYDTGLPVLTSPTNLPPHQASTEPSATLQTYLPLHCDQSSHSFTIALNGMDEYVGGGTYFPSLGTVMRPGEQAASFDPLRVFLKINFATVLLRYRTGVELPRRQHSARRRTDCARHPLHPGCVRLHRRHPRRPAPRCCCCSKQREARDH